MNKKYSFIDLWNIDKQNIDKKKLHKSLLKGYKLRNE